MATGGGVALRAADIPGDFVPEPIGPRDEVLERLSRQLPGSSIDSWGDVMLTGDGYCLEVNVGRPTTSTTTSITFHARGSGDEVVDLIADVLDAFNLRAIETGSGDFFERSNAHAAFHEWQTFRDVAIGRVEPGADHQPR